MFGAAEMAVVGGAFRRSGEELRQELAQLHARFQELAGQPKGSKPSGSRKKAGPETFDAFNRRASTGQIARF